MGISIKEKDIAQSGTIDMHTLLQQKVPGLQMGTYYSIYAEVRVVCSYSDYQKILPQLAEHGFREEGTDYGEAVTVRGSILKSRYADLADSLVQITSARINIEMLSEKYGI